MSRRKKNSKSPDKAPDDFDNFSEIFATYLSNKFFCGFHDKALDYVAAKKDTCFQKEYRYTVKTYAEGFTLDSKLYKILLSDLSKSYYEHLRFKINDKCISKLICKGILCEYFTETREPEVIACDFMKQVVGATATFCMTEFISEKEMQRSPKLNIQLKNKILKIIKYKSQEIFKKIVSKLHGKYDTDMDSSFMSHLSLQIKDLKERLSESEKEKEKFYNYTQQLYTALIDANDSLEKSKQKNNEMKSQMEKQAKCVLNTKIKKDSPKLVVEDISKKDKIKLLDIASTIEKLDEDCSPQADIKLIPEQAFTEEVELDILKTSFEDEDYSLDSQNQFSFDSD